MVRYFEAGTNVVNVPDKVIFKDKKGNTHLFPTLTKKKHNISSHYGHPAITSLSNPVGKNIIKVNKGNLVKYEAKVKKQKKAHSDLIKATTEVVDAGDAIIKKRGRPRKSISNVSTVPKVPKKRGRKSLTVEEKAARLIQRKMNKADKLLSKINDGKQDKNNLISKLNASVIADDIFNNLLPAAMASLPASKRGRPVGSTNKKKN
jgi:hypothetical protein